MKKIIVLISIVLILSIGATSIVIAQDSSPSQRSTRIENALNDKLEQALDRGLIEQRLVDRIHSIWANKSEDEQLQFYNRVCNMLKSKQRQARLERAFFSTLDKAIEQGYIAPEKYREIARLWKEKSPKEKLQLYKRLCNLVDSQSSVASRR